MRSIVNSGIIGSRLGNSFCSSSPYIFNDKGKIEKKSIALMMSSRPLRVSIDHIRETYQINNGLRAFKAVGYEYGLDELADLFMENDFEGLESKGEFLFFRNYLLRVAQKRQNKELILKMRINRNVSNILILFKWLQGHSKNYFRRSLFAFLAEYLQVQVHIEKTDYFRIVSYLTERSYISKTIVEQFERLRYQDIFEDMKNEGKMGVKQFQRIFWVLKSVLNMQRWERQGLIECVVEKDLKEKLLKKYFEILDDNEMFQEILVGFRFEEVFIDQLFMSHKGQYLRIIQRIFDPVFLTSAKLERSFVALIFDRLLLYTDKSDIVQVVKILKRYSKAVSGIITMNVDPIWGGGSLLPVCQKYNFYNKDLFSYIRTKFLQNSWDVRVNNTSYYSRNRRYLQINMKIMRLRILGIYMQILSDNNILADQEMQNNFIKSFQGYFDPGKMGESLALQEYILQYDYKLAKRMKIKTDFSHYVEFCDEYFPDTICEVFQGYSERVEKKYEILFNHQIIEDFQHPVTLRTNKGARIFGLIKTMNFYGKISSHQKRKEYIYELVSNHMILNEMLIESIAYPGLLEGVFEMKQIYKNCRDNKITLFDNSYGQIKKEVNRIYKDFLGVKQKSGVQIQFIKGIEVLTSPLCVKPSVYHLGNLGKTFESLIQVSKEQQEEKQKLKALVIKEFKRCRQVLKVEGKNKEYRIYTYFIDFPYFGDFLIVNGQHKTILILDENGRKQSLIPFKGESSIQYFESKGYTVLLVKGVKDIEKISDLFQFRDLKAFNRTLFGE